MNSNKSKKKLTRKPDWLRVTGFSGEQFARVTHLLKDLHLNTVCHAANCPNRGECFNRGTATFLILGPTCTRNCRFCDIAPGKPPVPDVEEPSRVAEAARILALRHVVITSVTRDDLPDGGAGQFARTIEEIRKVLPMATVEVLTPDFKHAPEGPQIIIQAKPDIFNHNVETVPRLYPLVRPGADYLHSLQLLKQVHEQSSIVTKSGLMVGLGETREELQTVFFDLAEQHVSIITIGQYLAPSKHHLPVTRYLHPDEFGELKADAQRAGIPHVASGPLIRSSYRADEFVSSG